MGWLDFLRRSPDSTQRSAIVTYDDDAITCRRWDGVVESVRWSDLRAVILRTTSEGPLVDDVYWILAGNSSGCVVPSEAEGAQALLKRLQQLPSFNNNAAIEAMSCTDDREFLCWQRADVQ